MRAKNKTHEQIGLLDILRWPEPALLKKAEPVHEVTDEIRSLAEKMTATMRSAPGLGLAAPQVGVSLRLIVIDPSAAEPEYAGTNPIALINPVIVKSGDKIADEEGCLSVPGIYENIPRPAWLTARFTTLDGRSLELDAKGRLARCVAHEVDHLDGVLFWDHLSRLKRDWLKLKFKRKSVW